MKWWPFKKKRETSIIVAQVDDPLDPHGDGTLRPGDIVYDLMMKDINAGRSGGLTGYKLDDGTWALEVQD